MLDSEAGNPEYFFCFSLLYYIKVFLSMGRYANNLHVCIVVIHVILDDDVDETEESQSVRESYEQEVGCNYLFIYLFISTWFIFK